MAEDASTLEQEKAEGTESPRSVARAVEKRSDVADGVARDSSQAAEKKTRNSRMTVKTVDGEPPAQRKMLFDEAHRLATMPRRKWDERTSAAFWAAIATAIPAYAGFTDLMLPAPKDAKLAIAELGIFVLCVGIAAAGIRRPGKTAEQYLNELYCISEKAPGKLLKFWRNWMGS